MRLTVVRFRAPYVDEQKEIRGVYLDGRLTLWGDEEVTGTAMWVEGFMEAADYGNLSVEYQERDCVDSCVALYGAIPPVKEPE